MNVFMPNLYLRLNGEKHVTICDSHTHMRALTQRCTDKGCFLNGKV